MKFSNRVSHLEAEGAYAVLARAQELERQGREILHLELGQADFFTPEHVKEKGVQAIHENRTRYTPPAGLHRFRELIAEFAGKQRNVSITPDMVVVGPGSKVGLFVPTLAVVEGSVPDFLTGGLTPSWTRTRGSRHTVLAGTRGSDPIVGNCRLAPVAEPHRWPPLATVIHDGV